MSLYNMMHGYHPLVGPLLADALGFDTPEKRAQIPRFRDVYLFQDEIRILTRTGGGNRDDYIEENEFLRNWPGFIRDWDDDFDCTFAWWSYKWPDDEELRANLQLVLDMIKDKRPDLLPESLKPLTDAALERINNMEVPDERA